MADGSIVFDTKINNSGLSAGLKEAKAAIKEVEAEIRKERKYVDSLYSQLEKTPNDAGIQSTIEKHEDALQRLMNEWDMLDAKISEAGSGANAPLSESAVGATEGNARSLSGTIGSLTERMKELAKTNADKFMARFKNESKTSTPTANGLAKAIFSLGNMFKMMATRMAIRAVLKSVTTGFKNLILYSSEVNKAMSGISASGTAFSNALLSAFSPIITAVAPMLARLIDYCTAAANAIGRLFAMIGGKTTYTKAVKANKNLAASYAGVGSAAEKAKGQAASFDEFHLVGQDKSSGGGGGGADIGSMFDTEEVGKPTELANRLKAIMEDIVGIAKALKKAWMDAWNSGYGEVIMYKIREIGWDVLDTIKAITGATREWAENLNLEPLMKGIMDVLLKLEPVIDTILGAVEWIWINILLPLASWVAESALPAFLELIAGALAVLQPVLEIIGSALQFLWDTFIQPFVSAVGDAIVKTIETLADWLKQLAKWIDKNREFLENVAIVVAVVIGVFQALSAITTIVGVAMTAFSGILGAVGAVIGFVAANPITLIIGAILGLIAVLIKACGGWDGFKEKVSEVIEKVKGWISSFINKAKEQFQTMSDNISEKIGIVKGVFSGFLNWIGTTFTSGWKSAWNGVKTAFGNIFSGLGNIAKSALNAAIRAINRISFTIPSWIPVFGGNHFGFSIPYLASGAYVPPNAGEFMAVLGDNKKEGEFVAPESKLKEAMEEAGGGMNEEILAALNTLIAVVKAKPTGITKKELGSAAVDYINEETVRTNNSPILI